MDLRSDAGEMYDLEADTHERRNLFDDPCYTAMRTRLDGYLHRRSANVGPVGSRVGPG